MPDLRRREREWGFSFRRMNAIVLRHYYLLRSSWARVLELAYWPVINMTLWGFMTVFLVGQSSLFAQASGLLLAAILLWDVLFRSQLGSASPSSRKCGRAISATSS